MVYVIQLLLCILMENVSAAFGVDLLVKTELGQIQGVMSSDDQYSMFMGIPYAHVNATNPFGLSIPNPRFQNTFKAFDDSAICPQVEEFNHTITGTLDSLHLNIYVPQKASLRNRLPVLLWIYGGSFTIGFSGRYLYGPSYYMKQDIILVTINYRLGPYGFMCLDHPKVSGNQGLKDQQIAIKWVKDNIKAFGGDADKITLYGESSGGVSVDFHLIYSQKRLFDKVILQSGTSLDPWAFSEPDLDAPFKLSEHLGFETDDVNEALTYLSSVNPHLLIAVSVELQLEYKPCVEKYFDNSQQFIDVHPTNANIANLNNIPILIGFNNHESIYNYPMLVSQLNNNYFIDQQIFGNLAQGFRFAKDKLKEMEMLVKHFYVGDDEFNEGSLMALIDFTSDFNINHPTERSIKKYIDSGARNIFHYVFAYVGERNFVKERLNLTIGGASHCDEIGYQFEISYMSKPNAEDQLIVDRMTTLWANFVKYGKPIPEPSELLPVIWLPVTANTLTFLEINTDLSVDRRPFHRRMTFWDLFYRHNANSIIGYNTDDLSETIINDNLSSK